MTSSELKLTRKPVNLKVAVFATDIHETRVMADTYHKKVILLMDTYWEDVKKMGVKITERVKISLSGQRQEGMGGNFNACVD